MTEFAANRLEHMIDGYVECLYFTDEGELGKAELSSEACAQIRSDCTAFLSRMDTPAAYDAVRLGHDFYFTRNGHGVGFWDRPEIYGSQSEPLTVLADSFGEVWPYIADDGQIYF